MSATTWGTSSYSVAVAPSAALTSVTEMAFPAVAGRSAMFPGVPSMETDTPGAKVLAMTFTCVAPEGISIAYRLSSLPLEKPGAHRAASLTKPVDFASPIGMFCSSSSGRLASTFKNASVGVDMVGWLGSFDRSLRYRILPRFAVRVRASSRLGSVVRSFGRRADFNVRIDSDSDSTRSSRDSSSVCVVGAPLIASPPSLPSLAPPCERSERESSHGVRGGEKEEKA